ncbi:MAG TPA: hypothetical protein VHG33_03330 [Woeseiaceae bacterium]|nr:hypothetical protein [Woeseiaceae bacterium]
MRHERTGIMKSLQWSLPATLALFVAGVAIAEAPADSGAGDVLKAPRDGRIGYVLTERRWAVYSEDDLDKTCPNGFNSGPRDQFDRLFPMDNGQQYTELETRLMREGRQAHPSTSEDPFPFYEAQGHISYGLNLDGEIGPDDLQSPTGEKGIDNQVYRAVGCIDGYRYKGAVWQFDTDDMLANLSNRFVIELTGVDDFRNDDDVTVTTYRGLDGLHRDATGALSAGGIQRIDLRWGQPFIYRLQGRIVDGVLTTEPVDDFKLLWSMGNKMGGHQLFQGFRMQIELSPGSAEGLFAGYVDIDRWDHNLNTNWTTHFQAYGHVSQPSLYRAMSRLADGYPDPVTGKNTAVSSAVEVSFVQVHVLHPPEDARVARTE